MLELYRELQQRLEAGETVAVATVVRRKGSTPREVGAQMLVQRDGKISGTIGGGCGEAEVWRVALQVIETGWPRMVLVELTEEMALDSQGVCGGIFEVFVQPWRPITDSETDDGQAQSETSDKAAMSMRDSLGIAQAISHELAEDHGVVLATVIASGGEWAGLSGKQGLFNEQGQMVCASETGFWLGELREEVSRLAQTTLELEHAQVFHIQRHELDSLTWIEFFLSPILPQPTLLIAGAGHIAVPLAVLATALKFSVSVTDDRVSFANRERFPTAREILVGDIETALRRFPVSRHTHIVLVTRAHSHDVAGLRAVLASPAAYIGMIGSQRRIWTVLKLLHNEGVPNEQLLRIAAPIGLDLGGQTPEEIALAIMAEIVYRRRRGSGMLQPLSESLRTRFESRLQNLDLDDTAEDIL
jgi:xanthine dehydrogenase accessory factor